ARARHSKSSAACSPTTPDLAELSAGGAGVRGHAGPGSRRPLKPPRLARHLARAPPPGPPSPETGVARRLLRRTARAAETPCASGRATARRIRSRRDPGPACPRTPAPPSALRESETSCLHREGLCASPVDPCLPRGIEVETC